MPIVTDRSCLDIGECLDKEGLVADGSEQHLCAIGKDNEIAVVTGINLERRDIRIELPFQL